MRFLSLIIGPQLVANESAPYPLNLGGDSFRSLQDCANFCGNLTSSPKWHFAYERDEICAERNRNDECYCFCDSPNSKLQADVRYDTYTMTNGMFMYAHAIQKNRVYINFYIFHIRYNTLIATRPDFTPKAKNKK